MSRPGQSLAAASVESRFRHVRLKHVCDVIPSNVDKISRESEIPVRLCNYTDVYKNALITSDMELMEATASPGQAQRLGLRQGDTIITKDSETADDIAVPAFVAEPLDGVVCGYHLAIIRPLRDFVPRYLNWLFSSRTMQSYFEVAAKGLTRVGLTGDAIGNAPVPFPPPDEQRCIAAFLDFETARIDELVREQEGLGRLLAERRTAVVAAAVLDAPDDQGASRLSDGWTRAKLGYRYAIELGKMLDAKQNIGGNQYPYLRNQDVQWGRINTTSLPMIKLEPEEVSRYTVSDGDILVCEGGDVGRAAIWHGTSGEVAYQKALHRLRPLNAQQDVPEYLVYLLMAAKSHGVFDRDDKRSTIAHLPAEAFRQYRFSFPPLEAQQRIVSRLDVETHRIDALAVEADRVAATLRERRSALITAAVTGQIDVSAWTPPDDWLPQEAA